MYFSYVLVCGVILGVLSWGECFSSTPNLIDHMETLHKLDDQQCIPRLICELAATEDQSSLTDQEKSVLKLFSTSPLTNNENGPQAIYKIAARIGEGTRNSELNACRTKFDTCPLNRDQLVMIFKMISASVNKTTNTTP